MAQLRCSRTSEVVYEGTPLECVVHALELGGAEIPPPVKAGEDWTPAGELFYDDVGPNFDPDALLEARRESVDGLAGAAAAAKGTEAKQLDKAAKAAAASLDPDRKALEQIKRNLEATRDAQDERLAAEAS